jgi:hypothetical protein
VKFRVETDCKHFKLVHEILCVNEGIHICEGREFFRLMPEKFNVDKIRNALFPAWNFVHEAIWRGIKNEMLDISNWGCCTQYLWSCHTDAMRSEIECLRELQLGCLWFHNTKTLPARYFEWRYQPSCFLHHVTFEKFRTWLLPEVFPCSSVCEILRRSCCTTGTSWRSWRPYRILTLVLGIELDGQTRNARRSRERERRELSNSNEKKHNNILWHVYPLPSNSYSNRLQYKNRWLENSFVDTLFPGKDNTQ